MIPLFEASLAAAVAAGDVVPGGGMPANRFWFAQHVAALMAFAALPGRRCIPYAGSLDDIVDEASGFVLRGIGMTDAAIAAGIEPALPSAAD